MSDMSYRWCKKCKLPEYACECDEPDVEKLSPVQKVLQGIEPWEPSLRQRLSKGK
jgi:hypothetical protein